MAGTWTMPLIDRDEPRFAEATREMMQRGDYVVPFFNNRYRFDKPPLTYWFQAASFRLFGDNDLAARLPSAIAASLTALLLFGWGKRIRNAQVGWWAAIIFTLCLQTFLHAKAAVADMWLVLFVTAAHRAGYELIRDRLQSAGASDTKPLAPDEQREMLGGTARSWWLFYLSLAFAFLAKGPIGWTPLLTVAATKWFLRDVKLRHRFLPVTGLLLMLAIVALWGLPALLRTNGEFFRIGIGKHVVDRSVVAMEGHGGNSIAAYAVTLPFYFVLIFMTFLPWSLKLPWLARRLWRKRDAVDNYLILGAAIIFIVFTLVKTKLPHYTLPAYPLLALLLARALQEVGAECFVRRAAVAFVAVTSIAVIATPFAAKFCPSLQLMKEARPDLTREMEFGAVDYREPSLVWYFRKHVDGWMSELSPDEVVNYMQRPGARFVVLPSALAASLYPTLPAGWKTFNARGLNTATGRRLDLTLLLKRS